MADRDIVVMRNGNPLERATAELLRLPDGRPGVKWRGLVFPLHAEDQIEISDPGVPPGECMPFPDRNVTWYFLPGPTGADSYIFVDGNASACQQAMRLLRDAGVNVLRSGPNLTSGRGDWFIRIAESGDDSGAVIASALGQAVATETSENDQALRERLLLEALDAARASQAVLRAELERMRLAADAASNAEEALTEMRASLNGMAARLVEVEAEAETLRRRIASAPRSPAKPTKLEQELPDIVAAFLPRLDLIGGSLSFIAVVLPGRAALWRALAALDQQVRGHPEGWKALSGHPGWWERHFSTGQDNQGRIYARLKTEAGRWDVLVSHKQDQAADLKRLARL